MVTSVLNEPAEKRGVLSTSRRVVLPQQETKVKQSAINVDDCLTWQEASKNLLKKLTDHYGVDFTYLGNAL